jgi:hypothetical protein
MAEPMLKMMNPINPMLWDLVPWPESPAEHDAPYNTKFPEHVDIGFGPPDVLGTNETGESIT